MEELERIIVDYKNRGIKKWTIVRLVSEIYSRSKYSQWRQTTKDEQYEKN